MQAITITLNGVEVSGHSGMTILDLARESGVHIPTLCHDPHLHPYGACRICLVEDERNGALLASCVAPIASGMVINTDSEKVLESRRAIVKLMLASHPDTCMVCDKGNRCQLRQIATDLGVGLIDLQRIPHAATIQEINPFIERDLSKCIMCAKCVRADHELVVIGAIDYFNRGFTSKPATLGDRPLEESACTFCGTCVAVCPTGAIAEKIRPYSGTTRTIVRTVCGYCGCGCNIDLEVSGNKIVRTRAAAENSPNGVTLCARGAYGYDYVHSPDRLTQPLLKTDGEFQPISWEEATEIAAKRLGDLKAQYGENSLAIYGAATCTNEDNYLLQKFARQILGTKHIDNSGNQQDSALQDIFGSPASTHPIDDIEQAEVILLIGGDPSIYAPIVSYAIKRAVRYQQTKLVSVNSPSAEMDTYASIRLQTESVDTLLNGILKAITDEGHREITAADDLEAISAFLSAYPLAKVAQAANVSTEDLQSAARLLAQIQQVCIVMDPASLPIEAVTATANLALLTGAVGKDGGGFYLLRNANNAQGAADVGCLPQYLPGYRKTDPSSDFREMLQNAKAGEIKGMVIVGENPVGHSADPESIQQGLNAMDFLIVQDLFLTETAQSADLVLPAAAFAEKDGTFTNFERRVQRARKAVDPPGEALPDWQIIQKLANGIVPGSMNYASPEAILKEISDEVPIYRGITYDKLEQRGIYWPDSASDRAGIRYLFVNGFPEGYGQFSTKKSSPSESTQQSAQQPSKMLYEFGSGARTDRSRRLNTMVSLQKAQSQR